MNLVERVKGILLNPKEEWVTISGEETSVAELYKGYVVPLAAIGPVASALGLSIMGISVPFLGTYRISFMTAVSHALVQYLLTLAAVYVIALIIDALAPTFSGEKNLNQALKLSAYSFTPGWVVGIFGIIPALSVLGILGVYGLYLLYIGVPVMMKSPEDKSMKYTAAAMLAAVVASIIISSVSGSFISYPIPKM